jgi:ubiquinone/menaquinone biosynthesis C-methylase UbiE
MVLREINRVLKPKGGLLIRDLQRPSRIQMARKISNAANRYGARMRTHVERALRGAFTRSEFEALVQAAGLERVRVSTPDENHILVERTGESDPNSWIKAREQYL